MYQEINFDGLVGPTHNYAGLSQGNVASVANKSAVSQPKAAALQGLGKMKFLAELGVPQAILPPLERPSVHWLRRLGIEKSKDEDVLEYASRNCPCLLAAASSASSMWTANAATVAPSCDTSDGKLHLTPANLSSKLHRAIEAEETYTVLRTIFQDTSKFQVHEPLHGGQAMRDEGAANHTRLTRSFGESGLHLFVYGVSSQSDSLPRPTRFPARQTLEASHSIARLHRLTPTQKVFLQQSPEAIDAGVFHNDVISVGHLSTLLYHEKAFIDGPRAIDSLGKAFNGSLVPIEIREADVSLSQAVSSYLFNSQIVSLPEGGLAVIAPSECEQIEATRQALGKIVVASDNQIREVHYLNLKESMRNGGGPACLRQRVVMNQEERDSLNGRVLLDDRLFNELTAWVEKHYRDELSSEDLADPQLLTECRTALDDLTSILRLGNLYEFQN
ncbi:N-succinylarginine dihydrolase [Pelagicoccus mobilis]|uniref:N-succinylarginine dihydrolase n=1 Tax=Pelagicoccus mobilis TaxID=415221 RepID=A0A934VN89_9BACT|nr:N-succinylarginine dihydrolase [Pelagicoccus mobilis]MBK1875977.1 N-succinylarginine dihydrolase [Pelagicoccus mobilis]